MSGYDFSSPFKTPSKSKPAIVYQEISDLSFTNHYIEDQKEEIPDEEIAQIDQMLDVHDTDEEEDLIHEKSAIFDDEEDIPDSFSTPRFTPRKAAFVARRESQSATVMELTKLVKQMKDVSDDAKSTNSKISTILLFVVVLVAILLVSANRPYCNEYSWYPCQQCPRNAQCSLFSIQSCLSPNFIVKDNQVCIRNDSTGILSYKLANLAKEHIENLAYRVDCLGNSKVNKKVPSSKLFDLLLEKTLTEFSLNRPETTYTHAFNTMISIFEDNEDVYKISVESDQTFVSSRFQSVGSCLVTKHHLKPYNRERDQKKTITESTTPKEQVEETQPIVTEPTPEQVSETKSETLEKVVQEETNTNEESKPTTTSSSEPTTNLESKTTTVDKTSETVDASGSF